MESMESCVPPGFRFHPTDEELVGYYLKKKVASQKIDLDVIKDIDLYRIEPWDLQERCRIGYEEQSEWYFFSHKDRKYPTGTRTNRATLAGFWKATGRDKAVHEKRKLIGMRKTLVFYKGRAPNGQKTDWIMHEYRLETDENAPPQEEGWVVCRAFKKRTTYPGRSSDMWDASYSISSIFRTIPCYINNSNDVKHSTKQTIEAKRNSSILLIVSLSTRNCLCVRLTVSLMRRNQNFIPFRFILHETKRKNGLNDFRFHPYLSSCAPNGDGSNRTAPAPLDRRNRAICTRLTSPSIRWTFASASDGDCCQGEDQGL
ncbi:hypothetical protein LUZ62_051040 [Rhynchospora pubera]|uniref:NAC domain-containing protein n=1 Tax=Rhynchospora pubera TaxID=906938 RepID=A0AAV8ATQ8_9POAL|nr:hypothetical protein LUZ62_014593 [Rhynchospora pubera]KAJ4799794.1 hypothetical protein LUZ62_051040 [Rhynchospora pubera]